MTDQRKKLEQHLLEKALKDESFRKLLVENPARAVEQETGLIIPDRMTIRVLEEGPHTFFLVLPPTAPEDQRTELTEADLRTVSGGDDPLGLECSTWSWIVTQCINC